METMINEFFDSLPPVVALFLLLGVPIALMFLILIPILRKIMQGHSGLQDILARPAVSVTFHATTPRQLGKLIGRLTLSQSLKRIMLICLLLLVGILYYADWDSGRVYPSALTIAIGLSLLAAFLFMLRKSLSVYENGFVYTILFAKRTFYFCDIIRMQPMFHSAYQEGTSPQNAATYKLNYQLDLRGGTVYELNCAGLIGIEGMASLLNVETNPAVKTYAFSAPPAR